MMNRFLTQAVVFGAAIGAGNGNALGNHPLKINPGRLSLIVGAQQKIHNATDENNNGGYNCKWSYLLLLFHYVIMHYAQELTNH